MILKLWILLVNKPRKLTTAVRRKCLGSPGGFSIPGSVLHATLEEPRTPLPDRGLARAWTVACLEGRASRKKNREKKGSVVQKVRLDELTMIHSLILSGYLGHLWQGSSGPLSCRKDITT